jgi:hypothetical protein
MATMEWRAEPINREITLFLGDLSPVEFSRQFAALAAQHIADAKQINVRVLQREPPSTTYVDGRPNAPLGAVKPDGVIFTEFELLTDVLVYIATQLEKFSPVRTGRYRKSHVLLADGAPMDIDTPSLVPQIATADEFVFINTVPYARKIERGLSQQAPDGVYQAVANIARRRYTQIAKISFTYRTILGGTGGPKSERNPAIIVRMQ